MEKKIAVIDGTGAEGTALALRFAKVGSLIKIGDERAHHNEAVDVDSRLGFEGALACLEAGANDFGGTLMEESISKSAGANFGESVSSGELRALVRTIDRTPAERTTTYKVRRVFERADADELLPLERMAAHRENLILVDQARH